MTVEDIAKVCHEVNRAFCAGLGDHTQVAWEDAQEWQRQSVINGVNFALELGDDCYDPSVSHNNWMEEKIANGWTYGPVKDAEKKTHPNLLPFYELPIKQQAKDLLFLTVVEALALKDEVQST